MPGITSEDLYAGNPIPSTSAIEHTSASIKWLRKGLNHMSFPLPASAPGGYRSPDEIRKIRDDQDRRLRKLGITPSKPKGWKYYYEGFPTESSGRKLSRKAPAKTYVMGQTWGKDGLYVMAYSEKEELYVVTQADKIQLSARTKEDLEYINEHYRGRTAPLKYIPTTKKWDVLEPEGSYMTFDDQDEAEVMMDRWADENSDDFSDYHESSWARDAQ
jgi:hypothetical protein